MYNLSITNREIRDAIHLKLRQKLIIDFITNTKFATSEAKQITSLIKYCKGFIKDTLLQDQTKIYEAVDAAIQAQLIPLPKSPDFISSDIKEALPFDIPVKKKSQTQAIVTALYRIYTFNKLLDNYFIQLQKLPNSPNDLDPKIKYLFLITEFKELNSLRYYN